MDLRVEKRGRTNKLAPVGPNAFVLGQEKKQGKAGNCLVRFCKGDQRCASADERRLCLVGGLGFLRPAFGGTDCACDGAQRARRSGRDCAVG